MTVEAPCKEALSYPLECFQEVFLATPAVVGTFFVGIGGFAIAVLIWGAVFTLAIFAIYYVLQKIYTLNKYLLTETKIGQKISSYVPIGKLLQKLPCCKSSHPEQPAKKLINTQVIGDYSTNIVSKVHVDSKWFKNALKPFGKSPSDHNVSNSTSSPSKTPQKSFSKLSSLTPKLLSPKSHKQ